MPPLTREMKIIKIPLSDKERVPDYPKSFLRMPRLYLELFENKAKIKQDLINKEYIPSTIGNTENGHEDRGREDRDHVDHEDRNRDRDRNHEDRNRDRDRDHEDRNRDRDRGREDRSRSDSDGDSRSDSDGDSRSDSDGDSRSDSDGDSRDSRSDNSAKGKFTEDTEIHESRLKDRRSKSNESDILYDRLKNLLGDTSEKRENYSPGSVASQPRRTSASNHLASNHIAPTLAELEAKGYYHGKAELRDINHVGMSEYEDEDSKRELIFKFDLLKKSYPLAAPTIPEYTIHSDLRDMQKSYDATVRRLSLDSAVENYKTYLIGGFMVVEFVFGNFLRFDMQGFTQQQIISMHSYEKLLIELGEKSYIPSGSKWPVEIRLLFLIIMNAGFFIVSKMIMKKTGANLLNMVNNMNAPQTDSRPKRRMRGPNINIDDIPDTDEHPSEARK